MSEFMHYTDHDVKVIAMPRVFSENSQAKNGWNRRSNAKKYV